LLKSLTKQAIEFNTPNKKVKYSVFQGWFRSGSLPERPLSFRSLTGTEVSTETMIQYTNSELDMFRKAGGIAGAALRYGLAAIEPGVSLLHVSCAVEAKIRELGGEPAFPAQISLNNIAAHYCAAHDDTVRFREGNLAKLDVGVHVNGYVGDTAASKDLGGHSLLVEASREALSRAIGAAGPDVSINEVSGVIQSAITSLGFKPVTNLTGHAVGRFQIHGKPQIPNAPELRSGGLQRGMILAIEPFASTGRGLVLEKGTAEIFSTKRKLKLKRGMDKKVFETIARFNNLPFARRNLTESHPIEAVNRTIEAMSQCGMLFAYPPLQEEPGVNISQAEHTIHI